MKRLRLLLITGTLLALGAGIWGCTNPEMEAELAARNARLDELEKQDQQIRDILFGKLNKLRGKLLPMIDEIEANLKKRIDNESDRIMDVLADSVARINARIDKGFSETQAYIDKNMKSCSDDINDSFAALSESKLAVRDLIKKAMKDGDSNMEKLLRKYEGQIDDIMDRADKFSDAMKYVNQSISQYEKINSKFDDLHSKSKDLEEAFGDMEDIEFKLLEAMGKMVSQEYLASLEIDQINEIQDILSQAENMVDDLESCKDRIEESVSAADGHLAEMQDLASFVDGELMDNLYDAVSHGSDLRDFADELQSYLQSIDANAYLDEVEDMLSMLEDSWLDAWDAADYIAYHMETVEDDALSIASEYDGYVNDAWDAWNEAYDFFSEMEPYLRR